MWGWTTSWRFLALCALTPRFLLQLMEMGAESQELEGSPAQTPRHTQHPHEDVLGGS